MLIRFTAAVVCIISLYSPVFSQDNKAVIDLKSPEKAAESIQLLWYPVLEARAANNDLAVAARMKKFDVDAAKSVGASVDWKIKVSSVRVEGITFESTFCKEKGITSIKPHPFDPKDKTASSTDKRPTPQLKPFPAPDEPWVLALKSNDFVRVQGKVAAVTRQDGTNAAFLVVGIMLSDAKLSPAK